MDVGAQHRALPGLAVAEDQEVRLGVRVERDRRQLLLVDADEQQLRVHLAVLACARIASSPISSGSSRSFGPLRPAPGGADPADQVVDALAEARRVGLAVDAGECGQEVQLRLGETAARAAGRHQRRDLAVDLGVHRVTEPQLEAGAEHVAHGRPEVGPAGRPGDDVQAERQAA